MNTINSKPQLVRWFKHQIWSHKDKIKMPYAFQVDFESTMEEFESNFYMDLSLMGIDMLGEWMNGFLYSFVQLVDKNVIGSRRAISFVGNILAELIGNQGNPIRFADFVRICLGVLDLESDDMIVVDDIRGGYLIASEKMKRMYKVRVKIPVDETETFGDNDLGIFDD